MMKKNEVESLIKHLLEKNKKYSEKEIGFTDYCNTKLEDRGIERSLVIDTLTKGKELYYAEKQDLPEIRYKLIYKISSRYSLIIIVIYEEKVLKVINVIKTSKSAEKLWRKKVSG